MGIDGIEITPTGKVTSMIPRRFRITPVNRVSFPLFSTLVFISTLLAISFWTGNVFAQAVRPGSVAEEIEGELEILHEDGDVGSRYVYFLKTASERLSLNFAKDPPTHLTSGARVRARGARANGTLALQSGGGDSVQVLSAGLTNTLGQQRTLVILVNFQDNPIQPYTTADAQSVLFGTTSNFFLENSYQQTWLSGDIVGWYTIAESSTVCDTSAIATQSLSAATAAGINVGAYARQVFAFPQNDICGFWGRSTVGGNPSQSWINGEFALGVTAHELGHSLGLWHSHSLDCGTTAVVGSNCGTSEYGDLVDMMGASHSAHFNAYQKERLGWLNSGVSPPITIVGSSGTFTLGVYESADSIPKALKIFKSTDPTTGQRTWYYVVSRQALGFDAFLQDLTNNNILTGVLIHMGTEGNGNTSYLLDMTPSTPVYYSWYDPALAVGQTFMDPDTGLTMTTKWVNGTGAAVTVTMGSSGTANVTVATDQTSYTRSQSVSIKATVLSGGAPLANTSVNFTVKKSNGSVVKASATTGNNGTAVYKLRLTKKDPVGTYEADAAAVSSTAATNFTVR